MDPEEKDQFTAAVATIINTSKDSVTRLNHFSIDFIYCRSRSHVAFDPCGKIAAFYGLRVFAGKPDIKDVRGFDIGHNFTEHEAVVIDNKHHAIIAAFSSKADRLRPNAYVTRSLEVVQQLAGK